MSYKLRRDDGSETQGESPEEAAALMRGLEDAESGEAGAWKPTAEERAAGITGWIRGIAVTNTEPLKKLIRLPNFWPRADPDMVAKTVKDAEDAIGD